MTVAEKQADVNMTMPDALVSEVDARVGQGDRERFILKAVEEKLKRLRRVESFQRFAGSLADVDIPGWETAESSAEWVRALRRGDAVGVGDDSTSQ